MILIVFEMGSDPKFYSICRLFYPVDKQDELSQELATQSLLTLQPLHLLVSSTIKKRSCSRYCFRLPWLHLTQTETNF